MTRITLNIVTHNYNLHCEITDSHRVDYEDDCSLGCDNSNLEIGTNIL
jgi:hypothetical protein